MGIKERVFQSVLFELIAIALSFIFVKITSGGSMPQSTEVVIMLISISLLAMVWTFFYNLIFDKFAMGDKLKRPIWLRVLHVCLFEFSFVTVTLPIFMHVLKVGVWQALMVDISLTFLILAYGFVFYWLYDHTRSKIVNK